MLDIHAGRARRLEEDAARDPVERAQMLTEAAGEWALAGQAAPAQRCYLAAIADGGDVVGDARSYYADFLFDQGRPAQAYEVLAELWERGSADPFAYNAVGESLEAHNDPAGAVRWLTGGLRRLWDCTVLDAARIAEDSDLNMLLGARARVRKRSEQPWDEWDRMFFEYWEATNPGRSAATYWTPHEDSEPTATPYWLV